jgi:hypothetical protein
MKSRPTLYNQRLTMHSLSRFGQQASRQPEPRRVLLFCAATPISQTPIAISTATYLYHQHTQDSPQMSSDTSCEFCKNILDDGGELYPALDFDIFHTWCETCPSEEEQDELCAMCRHFNLGHLLFCLGSEVFAFKVVLGSPSAIDGVKNCAFHRILQSMVRVDGCFDELRSEYALRVAKSDDWQFLLTTTARKDDYMYRTEISVFSSGSSATTQQQLDKLITQGSVRETVDWDRVKGWVFACTNAEDGHAGCRTHNTALPAVLPKGFRVVDVNERRLVHPDSNVRFVALSYVWGKPSETQLVTTKDNFEEFQKKDSLKAQNMPRTIEDAIQVCRRLGERYLWVDRLSIIQNDPSDKRKHIDSMAAIYTKAAFSIVVACGDNMDVQIPGVSVERQALTRVCAIGTARLVNRVPDIGQALNESVWETRGWTFQEKILSRCKLLMTPVQLTWSCVKGPIREDNTYNRDPMILLDKQSESSFHWDSLFTQEERDCGDREAATFVAYTRHTRRYNTSNLSYKDDIYNAFFGILTALYPPDRELMDTVYGLPLRHIDAALLWHHEYSEERTIRISEKIFIPSWSWSSISGTLDYLQFCGTLVKWSLISGRDPTISVELRGDQTPSWLDFFEFLPWITKKMRDSQYDPLPSCLYMLLAVSQGCLDLAAPADGGKPVKDISLQELSETSTMRWPTYASYWEEIFGPSTSSPVNHTFSNDEQWLLRTCAQTAELRLSAQINHEIYKGGYCSDLDGFHILSGSGEVIGYVPASPVLDAYMASKAAGGTAETNMDDRSEAPSLKAMALSIGLVTNRLNCYVGDAYRISSDAYCYDDDEVNKVFELEPQFFEYATYRDEGKWLFPIPAVNVMFIGEQEGNWRRLGIGRVLLRRWVELERKTETITLW